jgi:hypothetical protein
MSFEKIKPVRFVRVDGVLQKPEAMVEVGKRKNEKKQRKEKREEDGRRDMKDEATKRDDGA